MPIMSKSDLLLVFGATVRRYRTAAGLSQECLAELAAIHRTYIGGIERGERNPTLLMIHRLATALEIAPSKLLELTPSKAAKYDER
jgi:transcriptional regulator with XRE-family HTH domain